MVTSPGSVVRGGDAVNDQLASERVYINAFVWAGVDKVAGDELILKDLDGNIVWHCTCDGGGSYHDFVPRAAVLTNGVVIDTITHGRAYAYVE